MPYLAQRLIALMGLVVAAPVIGIAAIAVALEDGWPVFYRGRRLGRKSEPFDQLKVRSMVKGADQLIGDVGVGVSVSRVTKVGRLIRTTSVDELPQLVNVIRGEMALVGPRPLLPDLLGRVPADHARFTVLPGITGLAQIEGRNSVLWSERLRLDDEYTRMRSVSLDVRIILRTIRIVLRREGVANDRNPAEVLDI